MIKEKIRNFFVEKPIRLNSEEDHRKIVKRGLLAALIYSIIYGFYEYFVVYNYVRLLDFFGSPTINWSIMYGALLLTVAIATRYGGKLNFEQVIMGLLFMAMFEDVIFWLSLWMDKGTYPFPAGNWWDSYIATFRVLGGAGWPLPIWPYFPFYYIPGFGMILIYYISSFKSARAGRIAAWSIGPLFLAIVIGALGDDLFAIMSLIIVQAVGYSFIIIALYKNDWKFK